LRAGGTQLFSELQAFFDAATRHDDAGLVTRKSKGSGAADACECAGDEYNRLACHRCSLIGSRERSVWPLAL
jgi:hypothetical protein